MVIIKCYLIICSCPTEAEDRASSDVLQARHVHFHFDEERVVFDVNGLLRGFQLAEGDEAREAGGHVADGIGGGPLEAVGRRVGSEAEGPVVGGAALVQQRQRDGLPEGPRQQRVKVSRHQDDVQGQVTSSPLPVSVQVRLGRHFVATAPGVERHAAQARLLTSGLRLLLLLEVLDLPDEPAVKAGGLQLPEVLLVVLQLSGVEVQEARVALDVLLQSS